MKTLKRTSIYNNHPYVDEYLMSVEEFNEQGELVRLETYNEKEKLVVVEERTYENGKVIETFVDDRIDRDQQKTVAKYTGDNLIEETVFFDNGTELKKVVKYDGKNRAVEIFQTDEASAFLGITTIKYEGLTSVEERYDDQKVLYEEIHKVYDSEGNVIEEIHTEYDDELVEQFQEVTTIKRRMFHNKNIVKEVVERFDKVILTITNEFDLKGNLKVSIHDDIEFENVEKFVYEYNQMNQELSEVHYSGKVEVFSKTKNYDSESNLIEVVEKQRDEDGLVYLQCWTCDNEYY